MDLHSVKALFEYLYSQLAINQPESHIDYLRREATSMDPHEIVQLYRAETPIPDPGSVSAETEMRWLCDRGAKISGLYLVCSLFVRSDGSLHIRGHNPRSREQFEASLDANRVRSIIGSVLFSHILSPHISSEDSADIGRVILSSVSNSDLRRMRMRWLCDRGMRIAGSYMIVSAFETSDQGLEVKALNLREKKEYYAVVSHERVQSILGGSIQGEESILQVLQSLQSEDLRLVQRN